MVSSFPPIPISHLELFDPETKLRVSKGPPEHQLVEALLPDGNKVPLDLPTLVTFIEEHKRYCHEPVAPIGLGGAIDGEPPPKPHSRCRPRDRL